MIGCTTATATRLAGAEVTAASWRRHHPGGEFYILVPDADRRTHGDPPPFVLYPEDLELGADEIRLRRGIYNALEYCTSLKSHLLRFLLEQRGADAVVFTDPDTEVYASLDDLGALARAHGICLTPHCLLPLPQDGWSHNELEQLRFGVFNTGLMAAGRSAGRFLDWWADRLRRDCLSSWDDGLFVDQRWADLVPAYFDHLVVRDATLNVAFWNLHERRVEEVGDALTVDGQPLRHVHFAGFDPRQPGQLTSYPFPRPLRARMSDQPVVAGLYRGYADRLLAAGHEERMSRGYPFAHSASGRPLGPWERTVLPRGRGGGGVRPLPPSARPLRPRPGCGVRPSRGPHRRPRPTLLAGGPVAALPRARRPRRPAPAGAGGPPAGARPPPRALAAGRASQLPQPQRGHAGRVRRRAPAGADRAVTCAS